MVRIVKSSFEIIDEPDILKRIEIAGRTCYKSEDKITPDSAEKFVKMIIERGHESVLEHGVIIMTVDGEIWDEIRDLNNDITGFLGFTCDGRYLISGNAHAWRDLIRTYRNDPAVFYVRNYLHSLYPILFEDLPRPDNDVAPIPRIVPDAIAKAHPIEEYQILTADLIPFSEKERLIHEHRTVKIVMPRGVSHEWVRSRRKSSYSQESTRFCNYSKDKFDQQITSIDLSSHFIHPEESSKIYDEHVKQCEQTYMKLINIGEKPEIARSALHIGLKTEIAVTYPLFQWHYFFKLRTSPKAHPQMREITIPLLLEFKKRDPDIFGDIVV